MRDSGKPAVRKKNAPPVETRSLPRGARGKATDKSAAKAGDPVEWVFSLAKSERGHKRREAILKAATQEFMQKGYQGASLRNIIKASGGSAETLYRQFGNKEGLFRAVNGAPRERFLGFVNEPSDRPVEDELLDIARAFLKSATEPESLALIRMMIGESGAMPEMSRMMWESGPAGFQRQLVEYFTRQSQAGVLNIPDPELAARQFIGVTRAGLDQQIMCGVAQATPQVLEHQAKLGVSLFLSGTRTTKSKT